MLSFKNLLSAKQIKENDIKLIFGLAEEFKKSKKLDFNYCSGLILSSLFFEPSTRTRFSFESSMLRLGGKILSMESENNSSIFKGESLSDMGRMIDNYSDIAVLRHYKSEAINNFALHTSIPIINAGNGDDEHPTQALVDLYTILAEKGRLDNLNIVLVGDIKYSRAFHSFLILINIFNNNKIRLVSSESSKLDNIFCQNISKINSTNIFVESSDLKEALHSADILYVSRIQKERFNDISEYNRVKDLYHIDKNLISNSSQNLIIMHALPKVNEISLEVDELPQAKYFNQAKNAVFIRMALLKLMTQN